MFAPVAMGIGTLLSPMGDNLAESKCRCAVAHGWVGGAGVGLGCAMLGP